MSRIRSKHTGPEWVVRRIVYGLGYRYRLHVRALPGTPDIVFTRLKRIIEVRGCFWHAHRCEGGRVPATRTAWWEAKLRRNILRDLKSVRQLRREGWRVLVVWECELKHDEGLKLRIEAFLSAS